MATITTLSAAPEVRKDGPISYEVRVIEIDGLGWRTRLADRLHRIERPGPAMVWTTPLEVSASLIEGGGSVVEPSKDDPGSSNVFEAEATKVPAHDCTRDSRGCTSESIIVAASTGRRVRGNFPNHNDLWDYCPVSSDTTPGEPSGLRVKLDGKTLDQGTMTQVVIEDTWVSSIHIPGEVAEVLPEVNRCKVVGEWLIPKRELLIVSLGIHTVANKDGKAIARERLLLIQALASPPKAHTQQAIAAPPTPRTMRSNSSARPNAKARRGSPPRPASRPSPTPAPSPAPAAGRGRIRARWRMSDRISASHSRADQRR